MTGSPSLILGVSGLKGPASAPKGEVKEKTRVMMKVKTRAKKKFPLFILFPPF
jgi:hypothetical protein